MSASAAKHNRLAALLAISLTFTGSLSLPACAQAPAVAKRPVQKFKPTVRLPEQLPVEVPFEIEPSADLLIIMARVNGVDGLFIVDTGASVTVVTPAFAQKINSPILPDTGLTKSKIPLHKISRLQLGKTVFENFEVAEVNLDHITKPLKLDIAGIIGDNVLLAESCRFDLKNNLIAFGITLPSTNNALPYRFFGGTPTVNVTLDGQPFEMELNSGSPQTFILARDWPGAVDEANTPIRYAHVKEIKLANRLVKGVPVALNESLTVFGVDFFRRYIVTFNPAYNLLWLE